MTTGITPSAGGYTWSMADSERLSARAHEVLNRMRKDAGFDPAKAAEIAARAAALPDNWAQLEDERIRAEQFEAKARIMLGRLDPLYRDAQTRHEKSRQWLAAYRAFLADKTGEALPPGNFVITGPVASGKTYEANAIARELLGTDYVPVTMITVADMIETMKPNGDGAMDEGQFKVAPVLVLDDLGAERLTEFAEERLRGVLDYRMNHRFPTIFTSNLKPPQIRERYEARLFRRIAEGSTLLVITKATQYRPAMPLEFGA